MKRFRRPYILVLLAFGRPCKWKVKLASMSNNIYFVTYNVLDSLSVSFPYKLSRLQHYNLASRNSCASRCLMIAFRA
jgi:hypothetical protein